eukprot:g11196.t1
MAGTRLAAHTCFLLFSLISVLVAWRLGVVKRAPLPLENMADPYSQYPRQTPVSASAATGGTSGGPRTPAVDIDVVLLRSPSDKECPSCAAALDAMQANPSLARNAFRGAAANVAPTATAEQGASSARDATAQASADTITETRLFAVREVNLRVVHADDGLAAGNYAAPLLASSSDGGGGGGGPTALDDWLLQNFIVPPSERQANTAATRESGAASTGNTGCANSSSPRYTFFIACAGAGDSGELPTFTMGKRRHGYLGLGCPCSSCAATGRGSGSSGGAAANSGVPAPGAVGGGDGTEILAPVAPQKLAEAAALAVVQALAGLIVAHVLISPVRAGDVHVRRGQAYRLNFSLLSEDPALRRCAWDFAAASRRYLRPLLRKLSPVASFAVQSQEVQYARLAPAPPRWYPGKKRWFYSPQDLQGFLGANDFSTLDLAAGWGPDGRGGGGKDVPGNSNSTMAASGSSPHSQVPVNFMMFCPSPKTSPLVFMEEWVGAGGRDRPFTEAYEVPGFGGVSVVNRGVDAAVAGGDDGAALDALEPDRLRRAFGSHVSQLRRIIGLPRPSDRPSEVPWPWLPDAGAPGAGNSGGGGGSSNSGGLCGGEPSCPATSSLPHSERHRVLPLTFLPSPSDGVTDWEVDALLRAGMARNRAAAAETLRSLAALVESQPEMEVSSKIADDVSAAIAALVNSDALVSEAAAPGAEAIGRCDGGGGGDGEWAGAGAMRWAREALRRSEAAYFDPTMVPQLYFPQDHLMAVYFPFLAPLAFPLIFGFAQELWRYYRKRQVKAAAAAAAR